MKIQAYLSFNGNCHDALNFYSDLFDAKIVNKQTYEDAKIDIPASFKTKLQHAELKGNNIHFMAYDASPDTPLNVGNQMHMSIDAVSESEGKELFHKLSNNGKVHHDYQEREWGYYGRCTDEYGTNWMINYNK